MSGILTARGRDGALGQQEEPVEETSGSQQQHRQRRPVGGEWFKDKNFHFK